MLGKSRRPPVINLGCSTTEHAEPLIDLPHEKKVGIGGDLCSLNINALWSKIKHPVGLE